MRSGFEKAFPRAHWVEWNPGLNRYWCRFVADAEVNKYNSMHAVWQHQQAKLDATIRVLNEAKTGNYGLNNDGADIESFIFDLEQALKGEHDA